MLWQSWLIYLTELIKQTADFLGKRENVSWENDLIKIYEQTVTPRAAPCGFESLKAKSYQLLMIFDMRVFSVKDRMRHRFKMC